MLPAMGGFFSHSQSGGRTRRASIGSDSGAALLLWFHEVTVRFHEQPALLDVSFALNAGQTIVLFGAAGSLFGVAGGGKTMLFKIAIGLIRPEARRAHRFGQDIAQRREDELFRLRRRVGARFQEGALFDFTG